MVTILDDKFQRLGTYWQWGWIESVHWLAPDRLLIGGFNDARDGGMAALLDPSKLGGQSPEPSGAHGYCSTCGSPGAGVLRMVVMPRTELNHATLSRFNRAVIQLLPDRIVARTIEIGFDGGNAVDALYDLSPQLDLIRASFGGAYWPLHDALRARGQLDHDREHCPDRDGPREMLSWDPARGWRAIRISQTE